MGKKKHVSFEEYFRSQVESGIFEYRVVVGRIGEHVKLYIHPLGKDGDSRDFEVNESTVTDVTRWLPEPTNPV